MILPLNLQFSMIVYSFFSGVLIGIFFDGYRLIRGFKIPKFVIIIEDILFWILSSLIIFIFLLVSDYGFFNSYVYSSILIGLIAYLSIFSPYIIKIENKFSIVILKGLRITLKNIRYAIRNIFIK